MPIGRARLKISDYRDERKKRTQNSERRIRVVSLSLTSMVDMFAILVIFLLTNTETVSQWIEVSRDIQLPKAHHVETPSQGNTIQVTRNQLWFEGKVIATLTEKYQEALVTELKKLTKSARLNVVADEKIPYGTVKKVLSTCQTAGFDNLNLAVQPIGKY